MQTCRPTVRRIEPIAHAWRSFAWDSGSFDAAHRPLTPCVEGTIRTPDHLVLVTLRAGARHLEVATACGHRFAGVDRAGAVSFVPAGCERRLRLRSVRAAWASVALSPALFPARNLAPFTNLADPFLVGAVAEFERLHALDGRLDPAYCETLAHALACYLQHRYGGARGHRDREAHRLPAWRLRRIVDHVDAHLHRVILVAELARLVGLSAGHLHRAFRATTGVTPLAYINQQRIHRAAATLAAEDVPITSSPCASAFLARATSPAPSVASSARTPRTFARTRPVHRAKTDGGPAASASGGARDGAAAS